MKSVIECKLTCDSCGLKDLLFYVNERKKTQTVSRWMEKTFIPAADRAHGMMSPDCQPETLTNMIPLSSKGVGFKPTGDEVTEP